MSSQLHTKHEQTQTPTTTQKHVEVSVEHLQVCEMKGIHEIHPPTLIGGVRKGVYVLDMSIRVSVCICDVTLINSRVTSFGLTSSHSQVFTQVIGHIKTKFPCIAW